MSDTFNHEADAWDSLNDDDCDDVAEYMASQGWNGKRLSKPSGPVRCRYCGSLDVFWTMVRGEPRLFDSATSERHVCPITDDAFEVIPE